MRHVEGIHIGHVGDLPQHLVGEGKEHPPGLVLLLLEQGEELFTVEDQAHMPLIQFFDLAGHILGGDFPSTKTDGKTGSRPPAHQNVPLFRQGSGSLALEVDHLKEFHPVSLRCEDQLILFSIEAQLKGEIVKGYVEGQSAEGNQFLAPLVVLVLIHDAAQVLFFSDKGLPCLHRPLPKGRFKPGQGEPAATVVNQLPDLCSSVVLGVIARVQCQRPLEMRQGGPLLVQIVVGIPHAEVPAVVPLQSVPVGSHPRNGPFEQRPALGLLWVCQVVVGPRQFQVNLRGAGICGDPL